MPVRLAVGFALILHATNTEQGVLTATIAVVYVVAFGHTYRGGTGATVNITLRATPPLALFADIAEVIRTTIA